MAPVHDAVEDESIFGFLSSVRRNKVLPAPEEADFVWAREHPGQWQYFVDPYADTSALTQANLMGGRLADDKGEFTDLWLNPEFVPTPKSVAYPIENVFELVLWRLEWGFNNFGEFIDAFSRAELIVVLPEDDPQGLRGWPLVTSKSGLSRSLTVYTSPGNLPTDVNPWLRRAVSGCDVLDQVCPQARVSVNFLLANGGLISFPGEVMTGWWREWSEYQESLPPKGSGGE